MKGLGSLDTHGAPVRVIQAEMTNRGSLLSRVLADFLAGISVAGLVVILGKLNVSKGWAIAVLCVLPLAAAIASSRECLAKRVWIHPLVIMTPALMAVIAGLLTCRGFECGGAVGFLAFVILFTFVLVGLSFAVFYIKNRITRRSA